MMDYHRSAGAEAVAGDVNPMQLPAKLANWVVSSAAPIQVGFVRDADKAGIEGRRKLRENK